MSMTRRALMRALGMGAASAMAAPALTKAEMAKAAGVDASMAGMVGPLVPVPDQGEWLPSPQAAIENSLHRAKMRNSIPIGLPTHIETKRSWSPAFKQAAAIREHEFWAAVQDRVCRDRKTAAALCEALGIPFDPSEPREGPSLMSQSGNWVR
jgi:hypothetical protein